jgi:hypothetical protein
MAGAGRILPAGMDGGGEFGKLLGGLGSKMDQVGEKAMAKLREMKMAVPEKFQALMARAMEIFRQSNGNEKEQWDKASLGGKGIIVHSKKAQFIQLIKSVESTKLTPEEKREFYEKVAAVTIQQIH